MKAVFFLLDGETNASSRQRVLQYFPLLREHGIQPSAARPVPEMVYRRLVEGREPGAGAKGAYYSLFLATRAIDALRANRFDVAVVQRDLFPFGPPWLERLLQARNSRLVYDTDDATYLRPGFTPRTPFQRLRRFDKVKDVVSNARWVSAATEPIAAWARRYNANVSVVPMAVDVPEYAAARAQAASTRTTSTRATSAGTPSTRITSSQTDRPTVIGWAGTAGGLRYLAALAPTLRRLGEQHPLVVRVISGGYRHVCLPGVPVETCPWQPRTALSDMARFDIGLVPLDDTPFEQAKFPFKLLQYLALGVPAVASRVGTAAALIQHGDNGLLADSPEQWRDCLEALIVDRALRQRLAAAGQATVEQSFSLQKVGPLLADGLLRAAA